MAPERESERGGVAPKTWECANRDWKSNRGAKGREKATFFSPLLFRHNFDFSTNRKPTQESVYSRVVELEAGAVASFGGRETVWR